MADFEFTPDQKAAIESPLNLVITACPGSGKTSIVVEKIRREIEELNSYQGVIGITFTVKASNELRQRCKQDGLNIKSSFFGTIDHFCLSEIIYPFISRLYGPSNNTLECKLYKDVDGDMLTSLPNLIDIENRLLAEHYKNYERDLKSLYAGGVILLESTGILAGRILDESKACRNYIRAKYVSIYLDEYQDSSEPQHKMFLKLLEMGLSGVAVGDIQQSIYAWRGSDPQYIQELIDNPNLFEHHIVDINHRCHPSITNYANRLIEEDCPIQSVDELRVQQWNVTGDQLMVAEQLNTVIAKVLEDKGVSSFSQVAILVRANRSLDFLKSKITLPYRIYSDDPLSLINTTVSKIMGGLISYRLDSNVLISEILDMTVQYQSFTRVKKANIRSLVRSLRLCKEDELEQAIINVTEILLGDDFTGSETAALAAVLEDQNHLKQYRPIDDNEVQIMTLHKAKGLEFEIVFHLDLYDWVFPRRVFTGNFNEEIFSDWSQELNLHYVGITRAKECCVLVSSTQRINSSGETKQGFKSQFMTLPGLDGLYS